MEDFSKAFALLMFNRQSEGLSSKKSIDVESVMGSFAKDYADVIAYRQQDVITPSSLRRLNGVIPSKIAALMERYEIAKISFRHHGSSLDLIDSWLETGSFDRVKFSDMAELLKGQQESLALVEREIKEEFPCGFNGAPLIVKSHGKLAYMLDGILAVEERYKDSSERLNAIRLALRNSVYKAINSELEPVTPQV